MYLLLGDENVCHSLGCMGRPGSGFCRHRASVVRGEHPGVLVRVYCTTSMGQTEEFLLEKLNMKHSNGEWEVEPWIPNPEHPNDPVFAVVSQDPNANVNDEGHATIICECTGPDAEQNANFIAELHKAHHSGKVVL